MMKVLYSMPHMFHAMVLSVAAIWLMACTDAPEPELTQQEIALSSCMDGSKELTRGGSHSDSISITDEFSDFRLCGVKKIDGALESVFGDYHVLLQPTATGPSYWEYASYLMTAENLAKCTNQNQLRRYWDPDASEYRHIAGAPYDSVVTISDVCDSLVLKGLRMGQADLKAEDPNNPTYYYPYFSDAGHIIPTDYHKPITIWFHHALCQVRLAFYYIYKQRMVMMLKDISFGPDGAAKCYAQSGELTIRYEYEPRPEYTGTVTKYYGQLCGDSLLYADVEMDTLAVGFEHAVASTTCHLMLPTYGDPVPWRIRLTSSPKESAMKRKKTAVVPIADMRWQPDKVYTYYFSISDDGLNYIKVTQSAVAKWEETDLDQHPIHNW